MNKEELKREAEFRLGVEGFSEIQEWYLRAVKRSRDYIVFVVRRSYLLALLMERITGVPMENGARVLTDAGFMLHCEELAEQYRRRGRFPSILLCDDILIHGRNINHFLVRLEQILLDMLSDMDKDEIRQALVRAVNIYVYVRSDDPLLLMGRYQLNLEYARREDAVFWRKLSNDISSLILSSGMANASYMYSDWITEAQLDKIDLSQWVSTKYQGIRQYTQVKFIGEPNQVKAVYTTRLIPNRFGGGRLIPFVFLPNLDQEESDNLLAYLVDRMEKKGFTNEELQWISKWENQPGKRSINELITLIFGCAILRQCETDYGIKIREKEQTAEIEKLARNYGQSEKKTTEDFIGKIVKTELFTVEELSATLLRVISDKREVLSLSADEREVDEWQIVDQLENYFYRQGYNEEEEAYQMAIRPYLGDAKWSKRVARGCCFILRELSEDYNLVMGKYMVAYFLQMMDAGVLSLSSYAPSRHIVLGYAQYAKAGEQSLLLEPLKKFEYIPLLATIQWHCEYEGKDLRQEMREYAMSSQCDVPLYQMADLDDFVHDLEEIGQQPADWYENYLFRVDDQYHIQRTGQKDITEYRQHQREHVRAYKRYLQENSAIY